jgi:16S rRNA processing protein RimM
MTKSDKRANRVLLGVISGAHGIRGDVIIRTYTADPSDIAAYGKLETGLGQSIGPLRVIRSTDRGVIARLDGIADRTRAETLKGTELWLAREKLPATTEGEYYHADLIGMAAVSPAGDPIGEIIAVENFGAGDLLEIRLAGTQRTEYVPFTNAAVPSIALETRIATVILPELEDDDDDAEEDAEDKA